MRKSSRTERKTYFFKNRTFGGSRRNVDVAVPKHVRQENLVRVQHPLQRPLYGGNLHLRLRQRRGGCFEVVVVGANAGAHSRQSLLGGVS